MLSAAGRKAPYMTMGSDDRYRDAVTRCEKVR